MLFYGLRFFSLVKNVVQKVTVDKNKEKKEDCRRLVIFMNNKIISFIRGIVYSSSCGNAIIFFDYIFFRTLTTPI